MFEQNVFYTMTDVDVVMVIFHCFDLKCTLASNERLCLTLHVFRCRTFDGGIGIL